MAPVVKKHDGEALLWIPLGLLLVAGLLITILTPATPAQRAVAVSVVGVSLAWLVILFLLLARTPEGQGRLRSSPPVVVDLLSAVPLSACIFLLGALGPAGSGGGSWWVGPAAGAVVMAPTSFTVRCLWWEHERRRGSRSAAGSIRLSDDSARDHQKSESTERDAAG